MRVVYVDTLFFLNFVVDYFLLMLTARLSGNYAGTGRLLAGAGTGAIFAVLLFFPSLPAGLGIFCRGCVCLFTLLAAFGKPSAKLCGTFALLTVVLAGMVFALSQFHGKITLQNGTIYYEISNTVMLISFAAAFGITQLVLGRGRAWQGRAFREVSLEIDGAAVQFRALVDSGNLLLDPVSGKRVIVVESDVLIPLFPTEERQLIHRGTPEEVLVLLRERLRVSARLIPIRTVERASLMPVFLPEKLHIDGRAEDGYLLGISQNGLKIGGDCRALMGVSCS